MSVPGRYFIPIKPESLKVELSISIFFLSFPDDSLMQGSLRTIALDQSCPVELSPVVEMFYTCAFQYGGH